jgi:AcrR family transcriptional regulator
MNRTEPAVHFAARIAPASRHDRTMHEVGAAALSAGAATEIAPLFPKLKPAPHAMSREQVQADQAGRLCAAMKTAVALHGCERATVGEVCKLAGVSKHTIYDCFGADGKRECLLVACEDELARLRRSVAAAGADARDDAAERTKAIVAALIDYVAEDAAGAELLLVQAPGAEPEARQQLEQARLEIEAQLSGSREDAVSRLISHALWSGLLHATRSALIDRRAGELPAASGALGDWAAWCREPKVAELIRRRAAEEHRPEPEEIAHIPHDGLSEVELSAIEIVAERGLLALSTKALAGRAQIPKRRILADFGDCRSCLRSALDHAWAELADGLVHDTAGPDWQRCLQPWVQSLLSSLADDSALMCATFLHAPQLGEDAVRVSTTLTARLAAALWHNIPASAQSDPVRQASAGAIWGLIGAAAEHPQRLSSLTTACTLLALAGAQGRGHACSALSATRNQPGTTTTQIPRPAPATM